ncbi:hypothetical protein RhiirA4_453120 [Rhizophagus irregularis]|uniref:Uncharacterized protein n=1 Tax=Rhizophagus irregularis TaxID=588596 RepID=A0A2I1FZQ0_9GLOM|nr:hypothetical protein RhiirA4_453120 [Rhizophagus irregularis]
MEQQSVTYSTIQIFNYPGQTQKWANTNVISSNYKEVCKEPCEKKLREEREQKGQEKLSKSSLHSKQISQQSQRGRNNNVATIINIGKITCVRKGNTPKTLKCSLYQRKVISTSAYVNRILRKRRNHRQLRHVNNYTLLNPIRQLSRQNTNDPFANQIFNGSNFF